MIYHSIYYIYRYNIYFIILYYFFFLTFTIEKVDNNEKKKIIMLKNYEIETLFFALVKCLLKL